MYIAHSPGCIILSPLLLLLLAAAVLVVLLPLCLPDIRFANNNTASGNSD